jgi:hypothetical protein
MKRVILISLLLTSFLPGCGSFYHVQVNGFQNAQLPVPAQGTYTVMPIDSNTSDLAFQEYASMIRKKMDERGYRYVNDESAELAVFIAYGIDSGTTTASSSTSPVYGQTGGGMSSYSGMTSSGQLYSGTIMTPSQYGVVGSQTSTSRHTAYKRKLLVDVVDYQTLRKERKTVSFWKGETDSRGSSNNLRQVMPALIEATFRSFGQNSTDQIMFTKDDAAIEKLRVVK